MSTFYEYILSVLFMSTCIKLLLWPTSLRSWDRILTKAKYIPAIKLSLNYREFSDLHVKLSCTLTSERVNLIIREKYQRGRVRVAATELETKDGTPHS